MAVSSSGSFSGSGRVGLARVKKKGKKLVMPKTTNKAKKPKK